MPVSMLTTNFQVLTRITGTFFRFSYFELSGYNGNNGHVFTKKPEFAFRVLKAISGIKFYFFKKFFLGFYGNRFCSTDVERGQQSR